MRHLSSSAMLLLLACSGKIGIGGSGEGSDTGTADTAGTAGTTGPTGTTGTGGLQLIFAAPTNGEVSTDPSLVAVQVQLTALGGSVDGVALSWTGDVIDADSSTVDVLPTLSDADGTAIFDLVDPGFGVHTLAVQALREDGAWALASVAFSVLDPDADADGYEDEAYGGTDCDDEDPTIHPGAEEFCDGQDNDCSGQIDGDDATDVMIWYEDLDADGYGVTDIVEVSCQQPKDYVLLLGDCDDSDEAVHPGAAEVCDETDNDCDGLTDDEDDGLQTASASAWYPDADADGYGDYSDYALACVAPDGWIAEGGDCDDGDAEISPGADEVCDGRDNNCSDGVDEEGAIDAPLWYADDDADDWGVDDDTVQACDLPEGYAADLGDCDDADAEINPDAPEICSDGLDSDCDGDWRGCQGQATAASGQLLGEASLDEAGYSLTLAGDVDGDGIDDLVVGARAADGDATDAGRAYLVLGPVTTALSLTEADATLLGETDSAHAGRSVAAGADATDDGVLDFLVTAPSTTDWGNQVGAVYLVSGDDALSGGSSSLADAWHRFVGDATYGYLGITAALQDIDGDGAGDVFLGATAVDDGGTNAGAIYLFMGPLAAGDTDLREAGWDARVLGAEGGDKIGGVLEARADLDGDGVLDLVVGVPQAGISASTAGALVVLSGVPTGELSLADADATVSGDAEGDALGTALSWLSDVDGDGLDDLAVGAPASDAGGLGAGQVALINGTTSLSSLDGQLIATVASATITGSDVSGQLGQSLAGGGDHDNDGIVDLLIGAPGAGPTGDGAALLFLGPTDGSLSADDADASWVGDTTTGGVGHTVAFGGSAGGLDSDALLIGARSADLSAADAGAVLIIAETGL